VDPDLGIGARGSSPWMAARGGVEESVLGLGAVGGADGQAGEHRGVATRLVDEEAAPDWEPRRPMTGMRWRRWGGQLSRR
jgi:hypothetical protein